MKSHSKGNNNKNKIELLLRKALRIKQKPSQELNDSIIRQYEKNIEQRKTEYAGIVLGKGAHADVERGVVQQQLWQDCNAKSLFDHL